MFAIDPDQLLLLCPGGDQDADEGGGEAEPGQPEPAPGGHDAGAAEGLRQRGVQRAQGRRLLHCGATSAGRGGHTPGQNTSTQFSGSTGSTCFWASRIRISLSSDHQAKIVRKALIPTVFLIL